ncbi:MAG: hypothetical protein ACREKM_05495 [Longimicrobiales bacterium]
MLRRVLAIAGLSSAIAVTPAFGQEGHPHDHATPLTGPVVAGHAAPGVETVRWVGERENLTYSNPFGQDIGPVWYDGKLGYAIHGGQVWIDPERTKWANQYMPVYSMDGGADGAPERVEGQHIIYDTAPGDEAYSPIWRHNWVIVPRDYESNALRSVADIRSSDYRIVTTDDYFN